MAEPARQTPAPDEPPVFDPRVIERAYRRQRAKRHARVERSRERQHARLRFWLIMVILVSFIIWLVLTVWESLQSMFGL